MRVLPRHVDQVGGGQRSDGRNLLAMGQSSCYHGPAARELFSVRFTYVRFAFCAHQFLSDRRRDQYALIRVHDIDFIADAQMVLAQHISRHRNVATVANADAALGPNHCVLRMSSLPLSWHISV